MAVEVQGHVGAALRSIGELAKPQQGNPAAGVRMAIIDDIAEYAEDQGFPMKPQKICWDFRQALPPDAIVICDVGAHKMWMARMYQAERPNTCIISNGFASMGIGLPGAIAAKLAFPERIAMTVTGDGGFMMNSQEIETALRIGTPLIVLIWNDDGYGLIEWHQLRRFGRTSNVQVRQPRFREIRRKFRRQRLPRQRRRRTGADSQASHRRQHGRGDRLPGRLFGEHETDRETGKAGLPGVGQVSNLSELPSRERCLRGSVQKRNSQH